MAIINSVALGKCKGKIGNIVTTVIRGKSLARQLATASGRISSPLQITKQQKLTNTYQAYSYLVVAKAGFKKYMNPKENYYNFFVRAFNQYFSSGAKLAPQAACNELIGVKYGYSPFIQFNSCVLNDTTVRVSFNVNRSVFPAYSYLLLAVWSNDYAGIRKVERYFTAQEMAQGYADINVINNFWTGCVVYAYRKKHDFTSEIAFYEL